MSGVLEDYEGWTKEQRALEQMMSDVSEECWCAGWNEGTEYGVWRLIEEGGSWGMCRAEDLPVLVAIKAFAEQIDAWVIWPGKPAVEGPRVVALDEWRAMYAKKSAADGAPE